MQLKSELGAALGIKLYHLQPVGSDKRRKADKVLLGHRVVEADKMLVLNIFDDGAMRHVGVNRFRRLDGSTAAVKLYAAKRVNNISADGADVKLLALHVKRHGKNPFRRSWRWAAKLPDRRYSPT